MNNRIDIPLHDPQVRVHVCRRGYIDHWHHDSMIAPIWRLYWNPSPGAWLERDGHHIALEPGICCLTSPGTPIRTGHTGSFEHLFMHFTLGPQFRLTESVTMAWKLASFERSLWRRLQQQTVHKDQPQSAISGQTGITALNLIHQALLHVPENKWSLAVAHPGVNQALQAIHINVAQPPSCQELADMAAMHVKSFSRLFKQLLGQSPQRYCLIRKLEGAAADLLTGVISVTEAAEGWGFSDRYHLTRAMRQHLHVTPGALRQMATKG